MSNWELEMKPLGEANAQERDMVNWGSNAYKGDDRLMVRFYTKAVLSPEKSEAANRPVYTDQDCVQIIIPGDLDAISHHEPCWEARPGQPSDKERFAKIYERFLAKKEQIPEGTPLSVLANLPRPLLTLSEVEEFAHFKVATAEQLVSIPDSIAQRFMGINAKKQAVQAWLDGTKADATSTTELRGALAKQAEEMEAMRSTMELMKKAQAKAASRKAPAENGVPRGTKKKAAKSAEAPA